MLSAYLSLPTSTAFQYSLNNKPLHRDDNATVIGAASLMRSDAKTLVRKDRMQDRLAAND